MPTTPMTLPADEVLAPLLERQSIKLLTEQAPTDEQVNAILRAAVTVPDHGSLRPWRLVVITPEGRAAFGQALAEAGTEAIVANEKGTVTEGSQVAAQEVASRLAAKAMAAPMMIAVVAKVDPNAKVAVWEQVASATCCGYAMVTAAHLLGVGAIWKSSPYHEGSALRSVLDMGVEDVFLGWINLGGIPKTRVELPRPEVDLGPIVRVVGATGTPVPYQ